MTNEKVTIKTPDFASRPTDFADWSDYWTEAEMVEVFNRYCDVKDREKKYRVESVAKMKAIKAYIKDNGIEI